MGPLLHNKMVGQFASMMGNLGTNDHVYVSPLANAASIVEATLRFHCLGHIVHCPRGDDKKDGHVRNCFLAMSSSLKFDIFG